MSKTHDDSDSDIFGIAAQHVDSDDENDVALHDTAQEDPIVADIYPPDKSFRVQDPKKNVFKNFHSIERVFSGDKSIPQEVGLNVPRSSSADHEDISDDDSKHRTNQSINNQNPMKTAKTPTKSIPISPHSHLLATTKARVHEQDNLQQRQAQVKAEKQQRNDRSPSPHSAVQTTPISNQSHLLASTKSQAINHSLAQERINQLHQQGSSSKNSSNNNSSANLSNVAAISPSSHLLATTRNRTVDHSQAQEMLHPPNRRQSHSNSPANSMSTNNVKSRSPSPNRESNNSVRFSIAEHSYHFGRYSPTSDHMLSVSEPPFSPVRPISPQSHLLATTRARIIDHDLAQDQLHQLHPLQSNSPKKNTLHVNNTANFLRPTVAFTQSTDFRLELERRQEKRDIWWEERRKEIKSPLTNSIQDQVKSRLYEPTIAFKESVKAPVTPQGTVSRDISPSRSLSGVKTKALPADSPLLRATQAAKQHYKVTPPPQSPPSPALSLLGKQSYPQQHQVASKLTCETKAAKLAKWKVAEQLKQEENERYLAQKKALALAAAANHDMKDVIPVATPVKSPSERLMTFNAAMVHQARHKVEIETLHADPQDQGPGWNKLFTRDRIDSDPFRSRSPSPSRSSHSTPQSHNGSAQNVLPPTPPPTHHTTGSSTKKVRHSTGTLLTPPPRPPSAATASNNSNSAVKAKRASLSGPPDSATKAGFGSSTARKIVPSTPPQKPSAHQTPSSTQNGSGQKLKRSTPNKMNNDNNSSNNDNDNNNTSNNNNVDNNVEEFVRVNGDNDNQNVLLSDVDNVDNDGVNTSSAVAETY